MEDVHCVSIQHAGQRQVPNIDTGLSGLPYVFLSTAVVANGREKVHWGLFVCFFANQRLEYIGIE